MALFGGGKKIKKLKAELKEAQEYNKEFRKYAYQNRHRIKGIKPFIANSVDEVKEAVKQSRKRLSEASYFFSDTGEGKAWQPLGAGGSDISGGDFKEIQRQCYEIFKLNPIAKRVLEMITDFVIGERIKINMTEETEKVVGDQIRRFWNDYDNDFDNKLPEMLTELWVLGEQFYPVSVGKKDKIVKLGLIDPRSVDTIKEDPKNGKRYWQVVSGSGADKQDKYWAVINEHDGRLGILPEQETLLSDGAMQSGDYAGETFVFQVNNLPTQTRGYSELLTMLDSLDIIQQFVFQSAEKSLMMQHFVADILIKGATQEDINNMQIPDPSVSTVFKHNEKVELELQSPDLKATDIEGVIRSIQRYILAGVGIPEHWIVSGDETNFATAKEQNTPIEKRLERKQGMVGAMLDMLIRYQVEQYLPNESIEGIQEILDGITLDFPNVAGTDRKMAAEELKITGETLAFAQIKGWITPEDAATEYTKTANRIGMDINPAETDELAQPENGIEDERMKAFKRELDKQLGKKPEIAEPEEITV